jgi:nicotinamide-nucleotide amidase
MKIFDSKILSRISELLGESEESVGIAESVTSGLLQTAFSNMENCTNFYDGGITAYNIGQKVKHLKIDEELGEMVNYVSEEIACQMAFGAIHHFQSDWGIAITGYANPVPESGGTCFAYFAIAHKGLIRRSGCLKPGEKEMPAIQLEFTHLVLKEFAKLLEKHLHIFK